MAFIIEVLEELVQSCVKLGYFVEANNYLSLAIEDASAIFTEAHPTRTRLIKQQEKISSMCQTGRNQEKNREGEI